MFLAHFGTQKIHGPLSPTPAGHTLMTKGLQASVLALTLPSFKVTEYFPPESTSVSPHSFIRSSPSNKPLEHETCAGFLPRSWDTAVNRARTGPAFVKGSKWSTHTQNSFCMTGVRKDTKRPDDEWLRGTSHIRESDQEWFLQRGGT